MTGYHGRILRVDLGTVAQSVEEPESDFYRLYPGPGLFGTVLLLRETKAGLDALDAASPLIFGCGVAGGNLGTGLARFGVVGKSPLSGGIFESRGEGPFARALKGTGYDALVLTGRASAPSYLLIDGGRCSLVAAGDLWGMNTNRASAALEARHGTGAQVAVIGPAGERMVRFAGIVSGGGAHQTQRGGMGAVMGSKNLKAVVVVNPIYPAMAVPERVAELDRLFVAEGIPRNPLNSWQKLDPGSSYWLDNVVDPGYVASRNGQRHDYEAPDAFAKGTYASFQRGTSSCPGCANDCIKTFGTGRLAEDVRVGGMYWETLAALAIQLDLTEPETYFDLNTIGQLEGLDPVSAGGVLAFAAEGVEQGWLDVGFEYGFGGLNACRLLEDIAARRGVGDWLAEGVKRGAERIGGAAARRAAMHVKGVECTPIEGRTQTNLALGYATAAVGPQGDICEHDWDYDVTVGWEHTLERSATLGILERVPMGLQSVDKVRNYRSLNLIWSGTDALGVCLYACAPTRYLRLEQIAELVSGVTGWDFSSYELMQAGERRNALMRWYNLREGIGAAADLLPERYCEEPVRTGRHAGARIDRLKFGEMVRAYYEMSGWDGEGRPGRAKLLELGLEWLPELTKVSV